MSGNIVGWIKLHRRVKKSWLWLEEREFSRFEAWIDLLLRANWERTEGSYRGNPYRVERGELVTSFEQLAEDWSWSRGKVRRFIERLVDENTINAKTDTLGLWITICNYDKYQQTEEDDGHPADTPRTGGGQLADIPRTSDGQPADTQKEIKQIKEIKEDKEIAHERAPCVFLTDSDFEKLQNKLKSEKEIKYWLGVVSTYACQNPVGFKKKYKDHYRLILNWRVRKMEEGKVWNEAAGHYAPPSKMPVNPQQQQRSLVPNAEETKKLLQSMGG